MNYENLSYKKSRPWHYNLKEIEKGTILFSMEDDLFIKIINIGKERKDSVDVISKIFLPNGCTIKYLRWIIFKNWDYRVVI